MDIKGGNVPTRDCGGTAGMLDRERANATFSVEKMHEVTHGRYSRTQNAEWEALFRNDPLFEFTFDINDDRETAFRKSVERSIRAMQIVKENPDLMSTHMQYNLGKGGSGFWVRASAQSGSSGVGNHYSIFIGAILARASDEQKREWLPKAMNMKILGAYAQTECGHGSNVRALETTATYDPSNEEFIIDSPTLSSMKWWPGCFGVLATHAVVYARLIINGKEYGVHEFMVQLRDENHKALPGIEVGDVGPKIGYNLVDNGYCRFFNVRIPRWNMLAGQYQVTKEGEYLKVPKIKKGGDSQASEKLKYIVMISTRAGMVSASAGHIASCATVAIRYSAVRRQGFKNTRERSLESGEHVILDYQVQQHRLFKALSMGYAFTFAADEVRTKLNQFRSNLEQSGDVSELPELHATVAGLKAFCTNLAGDQGEELRRCCGGHGSLMSSGVAKMVVDFNAVDPIAEGDKVILVLQTARFLMRAANQAAKNQSVAPQVSYLTSQVENPTWNIQNLGDLVEALKWRAKKSVLEATSQFNSRTKSGEEFDAAWNNTAIAMHKAAHDHCFYVILSAFVNRANTCPDVACRKVLSTLARHFGLVHVREFAGDWAGVIDENTVRRIDVEIVLLLKEIRPNAVALVDAFGIKDQLLLSALGRYDGNVYEALYEYAKSSPLNKEEYVEQLYKDHLSRCLDREYLKEQKSKQRTGIPLAKL